MIGSPSAAAEYGLPEPATWNLNEQQPVVNSQLLHWIHHGRIEVKPGIGRLTGWTCEFVDGRAASTTRSSGATGFQVAMPFLDDGLLEWRDGVPLRTAGSAARGPGRLYFIGLVGRAGRSCPSTPGRRRWWRG